MLLKPKSIDDYGGLQPFLDAPEVVVRHNGYGFADYEKNRSQGAAFIKKLFNLKSRSTFYRWEARYLKEYPNADK